MALARKYVPLRRYLDALPPEQDTVTLTFHELEVMLGADLPPSAGLPHYWSGSAVAQTNWERSGFRGKLDRLYQQVVFTRCPPRLR